MFAEFGALGFQGFFFQPWRLRLRVCFVCLFTTALSTWWGFGVYLFHILNTPRLLLIVPLLPYRNGAFGFVGLVDHGF